VLKYPQVFEDQTNVCVSNTLTITKSNLNPNDYSECVTP